MIQKKFAKKLFEQYLQGNTFFSGVYAALERDEQQRLLSLLDLKGYYCYDYVTSWKVLEEESLPPLEQFRNRLRKEEPDSERHREAIEIWNFLRCRNINDYTCIYNVMDSINLAVICEERMQELQNYLVLNVKHFTSMSVYGAACATLKTRSIVQQIPSGHVMDAIESATHGGFACVMLRRAVSSRFYDEPMYIDNDEGEKVRVMSTIEALDENNQYGHKMMGCLCRGGFRHRNGNDTVLMQDFHRILQNYKETDTEGYIFQVSMSLPLTRHTGSKEELFPSVFEREQCNLTVLSPYQKLHVRRKYLLYKSSYNKVPFT